MLAFIIFCMEVYVMWRWVLYLWCDHCGDKIRNGKSPYCSTCEAELDLAIEKLLTKDG